MSRADGSIIIDTKISDEGIKKGSATFKKAVKNLTNSVNNQIKQLNGAFEKIGSGFNSEKLKNEINKEEQALKKLKNELASLEEKQKQLKNGEIKIDTGTLQDDLKKAENRIEKIRNELAQLKGQRGDMINGVKPAIDPKTGVHTRVTPESKTAFLKNTSPEFNQLDTKIANLENNLRQAYGEAGRLSRQIENINKQPLNNVATSINDVKNKITQSKARISELRAGLDNVDASQARIKALSGAFSFLGSMAKSTASKISKSFNGLSKKLKKSFSTLKRTFSMFFSMMLMRLAMTVMKNLKESLDALVKFDSGLNQSVSNMKSKLAQFRNQLVASFSPLIEMIAPWIDIALTKLTALADKVGQFFSALSGKNTYTKASYAYTDYAKSLDDASDSAKKLNKQVAKFDELNNIGESDNEKTAGAGNNFQKVPIDEDVSNFADRIKQAFDTGDLSFIGEKIGNLFNTGLLKIKNFTKKLPEYAKSITQGFNGFIQKIDWALLGDTLSIGAISLLLSFRNIIQTFDWQTLGDGIATGFNSIDWPTILSNLAGSISDILSGALVLLISIAENLDWAKLGQDIWNSLLGIITAIDWSGLISKAFELLGNAVSGLIVLICSFCETVWKSIKQGFEQIKEKYFDKYMNEMGEYTIEGFFKGILDMLVDVGKWIYNNIFLPFYNGFKKAFGINSPSKKMREQGIFIIKGLWNGINEAWHTITDFFKTKFNNLKTTISTSFSNAFTSIKDTFANVIAWFKTKWDNFTSIFSFDSLGSIGDTISGWFGGTTDTKGGSGGTFSLRSTPIPECATGTVIPARFGKTPVIVGDNNKEAEVISPLSTIKQAVAEVLGAGANEETVALLKELVRLAKEGQNVNLTGDAAKFFKVQKKEELRWQKATGKA